MVVAYRCSRREPIPEKNAKGTRYEMSETEKLNFALVVDADANDRECYAVGELRVDRWKEGRVAD